MKLVFNDLAIDSDVIMCAKELGAEIEHRKDIKEIIEDLKKERPNGAVGCPPVPLFIDLGKYAFSFFLGAILSGITYDVVKGSVSKLLVAIKKKSKKKYSHFIIVNGDDPNKFTENIYFFISTSVEMTDFDEIFKKITKILSTLDSLKSEAVVSRGFSFFFEKNRFVLKDQDYDF